MSRESKDDEKFGVIYNDVRCAVCGHSVLTQRVRGMSFKHNLMLPHTAFDCLKAIAAAARENAVKRDDKGCVDKAAECAERGGGGD